MKNQRAIFTRFCSTQRRTWSTFAAFCLLSAAFSLPACAKHSVRGAEEPWGRLNIIITDHDTGWPVPARCYLTDPSQEFWSPVSAINYVKPPERHFITAGEFTIALPPRVYKFVVERGPEFYPVNREIEIRSGEVREERIELRRWINMNSRGWYSGDLHNHRDWQEMPQLLLAEDLNLAPTLTEWVWENHLISRAPSTKTKAEAIRSVDKTHAYSILDTEIERLRGGPGALGFLALTAPVAFRGYLLAPPSDVFAEAAHRQGGYVDAEKITWRDVAALVALGHVDFAGIVHNHFKRHSVESGRPVRSAELIALGMIPQEKLEYETPTGMALWTMDVYYKFLNCGFKLPVSAGSASGVMPSPLGYNRVYVHMPVEFSYREWFRALKAGRSFATNGPMLFLTVNGHEAGDVIHAAAPLPAAGDGKPLKVLKIHAEVSSIGDLDRLEIIWKGQIIKAVSSSDPVKSLTADLETDAKESGWLAARAFEKPGKVIRFAHTSPVYVQVGNDCGIVAEDARFFLDWLDRESKFYRKLAGFQKESDRQGMLNLFRQAQAVYERLVAEPANREQ